MDKELDIKELMKMAAAEGARVAISTIEKEQQKARQGRKDKRLRNTKLLLKNYRLFKEHCAEAVFQDEQIEDEGILDIINMMEEHNYSDKVFVESIGKSVARTRLIMTHIETMMQIYKTVCEQSDKEEDLRNYWIIWHTYIGEERLSREEIAEKFNVDRSTMYRGINAGAEILSALFFGVDGIKKQ
ncbi:hypothetical protein [Eubacterium sp.]|uniref:hypothetical protein n=1 Tax=Eubacterium sp. TaxID=142586 RepID=UPI0026DF8F62|nr:hypothetical protein [Eubacterium sp.]MDO5433335.1 hypothetical protein [Eubacterium sp.]